MTAAVDTVDQGTARSKRWYILHVHSSAEKKVSDLLRERIKNKDMQEFFGDEILVPTENVVELKGGQKKTTKRKFFPGYVLVQMEMNDDTWHLVKSVPKVSGFVGGNGARPTPISDKEVDDIKRQMRDSGDKPKPKFLFQPGEMVRVIDGPFQDFNGTVEDVNFEKAKLRVAVSIFGRSTPLELEFSQVEKG